MSAAGTPTNCLTCRRHVVVEVDYMPASVWGGVREDRCREFVRSDGKRIDPLPCAEAFATFCGGAAWRPTIWHRIKRAIGRIV